MFARIFGFAIFAALAFVALNIFFASSVACLDWPCGS